MIVLALSAALLGEPASVASEDTFATVQSLQLRADLEPIGAATADLDGDGRLEVIIAAHVRDKDFARELEIWRVDSKAASGVFALAATLPLTPDVVAWGTGDVRDGGGEEIVLFNARGAFSWREDGATASSSPADRFQRLAEAELLWQVADPESVFSWQRGLRDIDGDGAVDLVLPEPDGLAIVLQRRTKDAGAAFGVTHRVRVPREQHGADAGEDSDGDRRSRGRGRRSGGELEIRIGGDDDGQDGPGVLVHEEDRVPSPQWIDWDADGDVDLLMQTARRLHVWLQGARGAFDAAPALSLVLPVEADRDRRLDTSYSSHAADLDGDRRADCAIFAGDKRSEDIRTQGMFFTQRAAAEKAPLFGAEGRPSALLVFAGFVSDPQLADLDGDGLPELALRTVRPDLIDQLRSASTESIDAELFVYRNRKGVFSREPDLTWKHSIPLTAFELSSEFCGDLTGDGVSELLVRDDPKRVRIYYVRAQPGKPQGSWSLVEKPLWQLDVHEKSALELVRTKRKPELFVLEPSQVLYVRFR